MAFGVATVTTNRGKTAMADKWNSSSGGATFGAAPKWAAMGTGATSASRTAASGDTGLSLEVETRSLGTMSMQNSSSGGPAGDTAQNVATITATASRAIDEYTLNDTSSSAATAEVTATMNVINLLTNDSIQFTTKVTFI